jgi:hypothetical protein
MKRNRKRSRRHQEELQVWTYEDARRAAPYVGSILRSLRETRLEAQQQDLTARRLGRRPGRPDRNAIIAQEEAATKAREAARRFHEFLDELHAVDVYCLDPVQGQALIPMAKDEQLAWLVYELFESDPITAWRYHKDPLEKRRPIGEIAGKTDGGSTLAV